MTAADTLALLDAMGLGPRAAPTSPTERTTAAIARMRAYKDWTPPLIVVAILGAMIGGYYIVRRVRCRP